jgi:hypothetical protein
LQVAFIEVPPLPTSTDGNQQSLISSQIRSLPPAPQSPNIWWESPEAKKLFKAQEGESTIHAVLEQIDILKNVNRTESSYLSIISGGEKVDKSTLSSYVVHAIRQKCALLCIALKLAVENMNEWSWNMCCKRALKAGERVGITIVRNPKSVEKWYRAFRDKHSFDIPLQQKHNLPPFLQLNPDACDAIKKFGVANLSTLTVEAIMSEYIHVSILPRIAKKEREISLEEGSNQVELQVLLSVMNCRMQKVLKSLQQKLNTLFPNSKATEQHPTLTTDFVEQY